MIYVKCPCSRLIWVKNGGSFDNVVLTFHDQYHDADRNIEAAKRWVYLAFIIFFAAATLLFVLQNFDIVTMSGTF